MKKLLILTLLLSAFVGWCQNPAAFDHFDKAYKKASNGDYKGSIVDYTKAINIDPTFMEAYLNRAVSKQNIGDLKGALDDVNKVIAKDPKKADAYTTRANINYKLMDYIFHYFKI